MRALALLLVACGAGQPQTTEPTEVVEPTEPTTRLSAPSYRSHRPEARVRWEMDGQDELTAGGWHYHGGGGVGFANGVLTTSGTSYEEWMQREDRGPSDWWRTIDNERGWAVETRLRVLRTSATCSSLGFWIHDGARLVRVFVRDGSVGVEHANEWVPLDTRAWHDYRIEGRIDWIRLIVDGQTVFEERSERMNSGPWGGTKTLMFGDMGGCQGSDAEWDWFAYDTAPRVPDVPCSYCGPTESFRLAQLRERLGAQSPQVPDTRHTNEVCLAYAALDYLARELVPYLPMHDYPHMAEVMRQAPHVRDAASAGELARYVRNAMERSSKPRMMPPPPVRRPPEGIATLLAAADMLEARQLDPAWRSISQVAVNGLQSSGRAQQASANLLSALANAARDECAP